ncbi:hypothetical protein LOZ12_000312 [Ophidiomyces ophidiicola]|uniref:Uncharacterized protein n=1 Tax=Ophidiomyces ophidiicola TaxID=1387563 RepID=A0ACB8V468_9EURO|nr:uncharacterized protein LOZ57_000765 [Ophidiomyces ophidiicola]KAI1944752.1 hypothetical protein LOZ62_004030 [Ophidiomyces ophidiicola]KAI1952686.1 hypothetical protein LOZ57_000765 [Ophidiomyces ophidiicola]KAI1975849.1 hypothetical protein LOZ56_000441 [Ophidiomyces ophidiicola]KAI2012077.1 hypothetical protein LOZ50_000399 [Ophidiomyces ophidiicola]KAI2030078.1 hypothetical protein LOZ45_001614 [Ophidiomyces ophidiicola]
MRDLGSPTIPYLPDDNVDRGNLIDGDDPDLAMDIEELSEHRYQYGEDFDRQYYPIQIGQILN